MAFYLIQNVNKNSFLRGTIELNLNYLSNMAAYKAILADEHVLFVEGLKLVLQHMDVPQVEVVGTAGTSKDLFELLKEKQADILLFELNFQGEDPLDLIKKIKLVDRSIKLVVLSAYGEMKLVRTCFNCGVDGYILKSNDLNTLKSGLSSVMQQEIFLGDGLMLAPSIHPDGHSANALEATPLAKNDRFVLRQNLTNRELEILEWIVKGLTNRQIAKELYISDQTVGVHKKNIMKKLEVNSTAALIKTVEDNKLI